jgi:hypothetical protein
MSKYYTPSPSKRQNIILKNSQLYGTGIERENDHYGSDEKK